jgi:drug/metabolite transporter (DMT)-like permease
VGPNGLKFNHPYFQCAIMFVGEFLCMFVYIAKLYFYPATTSGIQNPFKIGSPAIFDLISSSIGFVALNMVAASIVQMMGGLIVIINALLAYQLLGKKQYAHHWISLAFIVVGVSVVGYASQDGTGEGSNDSSLIGIFLLVIAMCFTGCQMVAEENLFSGQDLDPLFVVGCEGFIGLAVFSVILPIADKYECHN